jgi:hypothetical protein
LGELLERVHAQIPDVDEEEVDRDIAQAIREVRAEHAKQGAVAKREAQSKASRPAVRRKA